MSTVCTVIVVDPVPTAVINPELDTVAINGLAEDHVTDLLAAFEGKTVDVIDLVLPVPIDMLVGDTDTEETAIVMDTTHVVVRVPHRAVITADPTATAVMTPKLFTVALAELEVQVTVLLVAFDGKTVSTNVSVFPGCIVTVD